MGIRSLPVMLGAERAARLACVVMALPQVVVIALARSFGAGPIHAVIVARVARRTGDPDGAVPEGADREGALVFRLRHSPLRVGHAGAQRFAVQIFAPPLPSTSRRFRHERVRNLRRGRGRRRPGRRHDRRRSCQCAGARSCCSTRPGASSPAAVRSRRARARLRRSQIDPALRPDLVRPDGLAEAALPSTCRSTPAAMSASSTARSSTSSCASAPPRNGATRADRQRSKSPDARRRTASRSFITSARTGPARSRCGPSMVVGADGANSAVRREALADVKPPKYVFAYHEIVKAPDGADHVEWRLQPDPLRHLLRWFDVARLLLLGVPARRQDERRHRQRQQGILAARRHRRSARPYRPGRSWRQSAGKARRSH